MKQEIRPRVLIPLIIGVVVLGVVGILVMRSSGADPTSADGSDATGEAGNILAAEGPDEPAGGADWGASANAICDRVARDLEQAALSIAGSTQDDPGEAIASIGTEVVEQTRRAVEELRALKPPPGREGEVGQFISLLDTNVGAMEQIFSALESEDPTSLIELPPAGDPADIVALATSLGADRCAVSIGGADAAPVSTVDEEPTAISDAESGTGLAKPNKKLNKKDVVVMIVHSPSSPLDALVVREARAAARSEKAALLAIDATDEAQINALARELELRNTPVIVVFSAGPTVETSLLGYSDRETVRQAVANARAAS